MARRYYRKRRSNANLFSTLLIVGFFAIAALYTQLSAEQISTVIILLLVFAATLAAVSLFVKYRINRHRLKKLRALELIDTEMMDGLVFEKYVAELLRSQGYSKVVITERYDLGIDIIAVQNGIRWGVQVKRYSNMVKAEAVRQVVTALKKYHCQRAMVVTNSTFSRPAKILAESNDCILIGKDELAEWIIAFQEGG